METTMKTSLLMMMLTFGLEASDRVDRHLARLQHLASEKGWTFSLGRTPLLEADIKHFGYDPSVNAAELAEVGYESPVPMRLPTRLDWRDAGVISPIKDQALPQYCGSCWAFGTVAVVEALIKMATGEDKDLSEQQLVSCYPDYGSCQGGNFAFGFYLQKQANHEVDFPYQAANVSCKSGIASYEKLTRYARIGVSGREPTVEEIKTAVYTYGPVAVTVSASGAWNAYTGGVYNECNRNNTNHIIAIIGYDDTDQAWIIKNSHGTQWGEAGYMRIKYTDLQGRKCNRVGESAMFAVYQR